MMVDIDAARDGLKSLLDERSTKIEARAAVVDDAAKRGDDAELTEDEQARVAALTTEVRELDGKIGEAYDVLARAEADAEADKRAAEARSRFLPVAKPGDVKVGDEARTYRPDGEHGFFADFVNQVGDPNAAARIQRHGAESRAIGTAAGGNGLVPPQYLTDMFAPVLRAGRVFLNQCTSLPLPDAGMNVTLPRGTTGTSVAAQASENSSVSETNFDETDLTVNVRTFAGQQTMSRQFLERAGADTDAIIMADLAAAYAVAVDSSAIADDGSSGTHLGVLSTSGINAVTYTDATPTVAEFMPKLADAIQRINATRYLPADAIFMHPRRWGWLIAGADSSNRPLVAVEAGGQNIVGEGDAAAVGMVGSLLGVPVFVDANIPTNLGSGTDEDRVIVARRSDLYCWEDGTQAIRLEAPSTLGQTVALYGYSAFSAGRYPTGVSVIAGTGLIAPTF